jgi:protein-S-isoprenylcysteine O-methyltransferase Ste14
VALTTVAVPQKRTSSRWLHNKKLALDIVERGFIFGLYAIFAWRFLDAAARADNRFALLVLLLIFVSETLPAVLMVIRRFTKATSLSPADWMLAFAGTAAPLLAVPGRLSPIVPLQFCAVLILFGIILQIWAKLVLARSFGLVPANRGIKHKGPYRLIRHPMYAGYALAWVGFLLASPSLNNLLVYSAAFSFQVMRILREERFLTSAPHYRAYAEGVRFRLVPGLF